MFGSKQKKIDNLLEIIANRNYESAMVLQVLVRLLLLSEGCTKHPSYRAVRQPVAACESCRDLFKIRGELNRSTVAAGIGYKVRTGKRGKNS